MKRILGFFSALVLLLSCTAEVAEEPTAPAFSTQVFLFSGESTTLEITSGRDYVIGCNNTSVATASLSGTTITINAFAVGTAIITITDTQSGQTAKIQVTVKKSTPRPMP